MKAFIFDLDGTLIHSMPLHQRAWRAWFAAKGLTGRPETSFEHTAGRSNDEILRDLFPHSSAAQREVMAEEKESAYRALAELELTCVDGALDFMREANACGLQLAIGTAAPLGNVAVAFKRFALEPLIETLTSPADGLRGKPHPDIFAEAARRLGVKPSDCLVFEDAPLGVEAARRAEMKAVVLTTTLPTTSFQSFDNVVDMAPDFRALSLNSLIQTNHA